MKLLSYSKIEQKLVRIKLRNHKTCETIAFLGSDLSVHESWNNDNR